MDAFDYIKWKIEAKRKWTKCNCTAQWAKLDMAWTTAHAGDVQTHAKELRRRLKIASYNFTKKGPEVYLNKLITGELKPPCASTRELQSGATGGTDNPQGTSKQTNQLLDMQASWFRDMLRRITCGADNDRRTQLPEFPDGLPSDSDLYKDIRELATEINKKIDAIPTPAVPSANMVDNSTNTDIKEDESLDKKEETVNDKTAKSDDKEKILNKNERKRFEKELIDAKNDITGIHDRVSKLLTALGRPEESKKGNSSNITTALVNEKIKQCQTAATCLQDEYNCTKKAVLKVYKKFVNREAEKIPAVNDQVKGISDVLIKQESAHKWLSQTEQDYDRLWGYYHDVYDMSNYISSARNRSHTIVKQYHTLRDILDGFDVTLVCMREGIHSYGERMQKLLDENEAYNGKIEHLKSQLHSLNGQLKQCEENRNDLVSRLSQFAGAQLLVNNPGIADLSDRDRPTKLAERYSELYDNEWTDAFMALTDGLNYDDKDAIAALLNIITGAFQYCASIGEKQKMDLERAISCPASEDKASRLPDVHGKTLTDLIKECADISEKDLLKTYNLQPEHCDTYDRNCLEQNKCKLYQESCLSLCWKMALQSPPVYLEGSLMEKSKFDKTRYKPYQTIGVKVAYLVWPALYIHKGGQLLGKGVAEGAK